MEPRTHARGNIYRLTLDLGGKQLQWSHALTRVETVILRLQETCGAWLQWSHALTRVETSKRTPPIGPLTLLQWSHALTRVETSSRGYSRRRP